VRIVVAIGGNAIIAEHERGTWEEQRANATTVAQELAQLWGAAHELVLTHGNGPQVGALHVQQSEAAGRVPQLPFDALVAMTQGQLGYLLQTAIEEADSRVRTATVLTRVTVDRRDPSFERPTKPIGRFFKDEQTARQAAAGEGLEVAPDASRGWRTVVASPRPHEIVEFEEIRALVERGVLVIAAGGGGIPVVRSKGRVEGAHAVIDKDRASAVLASAVGAELLVMLTGVEHVALDFGTRWQRDMARLTLSDAEQLLDQGEFPPGSMGPKVESAARFVRAGGRAAVITCAERLSDAVDGAAGTWIVPDVEGPSATAWSQPAPVAA
jgi:carbamate kinase